MPPRTDSNVRDDGGLAMFGSEMLEVAIGVVFVFLLVSIICSAVREVIEAWFKTRAAYLERGIRELLQDKDAADGLARAVFEHPLIGGLYPGAYRPRPATDRLPMLANGRGLPTYIPSRNFALALIDIAARGTITDEVSADPAAPAVSSDSVRQNIRNIANPAVRRVLLTALDAARDDLDKARELVEAWYDSAMDRVSGWYKRTTHWMVFWIGLAVAVLLNINIIAIADYLYSNDSARAAVVARAEAAAKDSAIVQGSYAETRAALDSLELPIGWSAGWSARRRGTGATGIEAWNDIFAPAVGWLLTALAATMGAPFWFDLLNKVTVIRSTVKPHEKSPEEASEDRQLKPAQIVAPPPAPRGAPAEPLVTATPRTGPPPRPPSETPSPRDGTSSIDGCDIEMVGPAFVGTADEELPPAEGGVA